MGSTRNFRKEVGRASSETWTYNARALACGCVTERPPDISSPTKKWWCCGAYQKAKAGRA